MNTKVKRAGDDAVVKCNHTRETWYLTCKDNTWVGELGNCSAGEATCSLMCLHVVMSYVIDPEWGFHQVLGSSIPFPQGRTPFDPMSPLARVGSSKRRRHL